MHLVAPISTQPVKIGTWNKILRWGVGVGGGGVGQLKHSAGYIANGPASLVLFNVVHQDCNINVVDFESVILIAYIRVHVWNFTV